MQADVFQDGGRQPLRFGVMVGSDGISELGRLCIAPLLEECLATPVVLLVDPSVAQPARTWEKLRKAIRLDGNLWHLQSRLFPPSQVATRRKTALADQFPGVPQMFCEPVLKGKFSQYFKPEDIEQIRALNLDFILKFAYGITRGEILNVARYGVWSFHHGDEEKYRGGPPAFWEVCNGDPVTGALLQRLNDRLDGGVVLKKIWVPTDGQSYRKNLHRIHTSSAHMVRSVCVDLRNGCAEYLHDGPSKTNAPIYKAPKDWEMLRFWGRIAVNRLREKVAAQRVDSWNIGVIHAPVTRFLDKTWRPDIEWAEYDESEQMIADPFFVHSGDTRVLVEEFHWFNETGRVSEVRRGPDGRLSQITPILDEGVHMSYPYTFQHRGDTYCVPETRQTNDLRLYRLQPEDGTWSLARTIMKNVQAVDATIFEAGGRWWLLHGGAGTPGAWSLYIWSAPDLEGPWSAHPGNPVKTDVRSSRPAGNPFWHDGKLYRPAQDGSKSYGGGLVINRIDALTTEHFSETAVRYIGPEIAGRYKDGLHTLSSSEGMCVVDAKRHGWPAAMILRRWNMKRRGLKRRAPFRYTNMSLAGPLPIAASRTTRAPSGSSSR